MAARGSQGVQDAKGLYATLGVATTADEAEIRKAYRRLALRWHPDKNPDNPEATAEFQKISSAYEVLSDPERRDMYDTTGCIDAEELDEAGDLGHAADLFAAFFGGVGSVDLDAEEQSMLDEFLRIAGGGAFKRRGPGRGARSKKKGGGRGGRSSRAARAAAQEEQMMSEFLMAAMGGDFADMPAPTAACPAGHPLKKRKADATYACDLCEARIEQGKRFHDCRKCDFSVCSKCQKKIDEEAASKQEEEEYRELLEAFCDMHVAPVRQGRRLQFRCQLCREMLESQEAAIKHMEEAHEEEMQALLEEDVPPPFRMGAGLGADLGLGPGVFGGGGLEELFMAASMEDLLDGGPPLRGQPSASGGGRRSRKRR